MIDEQCNLLHNVASQVASDTTNRLDDLQRGPFDEDAQACKDRLRSQWQQIIAPGDGVAQRAVTFRKAGCSTSTAATMGTHSRTRAQFRRCG
jgi:hypothetical protein